MSRVWCLVVGLVLVDAVNLNPFLDSARRKESLNRLESCFCELRGKVEECCCDVETVDALNQKRIFPLLSPLLKMSFFRFYRVNLNRGCPFWPEDGQCVLRSCHVEECGENSIPSHLWENESGDSTPVEPCIFSAMEEQRLGEIDTRISSAQRVEFENWQRFDDSEDKFCDSEAEDHTANLSYVDLTINPERYTGYSGPSAHRVWKAIYEENCFRPEQADKKHAYIDTKDLGEMCLEKRAFYRLISGMHASINIHLSALYVIRDKASSEEALFGPNLSEFVRRFDTTTTNNQGPLWLKHLYFAYLLVLRAVMKAEHFWEKRTFYTGNTAEDRMVKSQVMEIVQIAKSCPSLFDESQMFSGDSSDQLKAEFKSHFRNITHIMDCVGCDKCKLWGKLQVHGIGTALGILFSKPQSKQDQIVLSRSEVVALFNVLGRLSSSIYELHKFKKMLDNQVSESSPKNN